jgi:hypothetical protein
MGSPGGGVMFMLGFIAAAVILILIWYFMYYMPAHPKQPGSKSIYDRMKDWKVNPFHSAPSQPAEQPQQSSSYYPQPIYGYPGSQAGYILVVPAQDTDTRSYI